MGIMAPPKIKISVIIPVYNAEKYISQCIESVLYQTLEGIEIICIDDMSKDNSYGILKEYAKKDNRIVLIKNEKNLGAGETRNKGLKLATGEYIHFLDADDYLVTGAYDKLYEKASKNCADILKAKAHSIDALTMEEVFYPRYDLLDLSAGDFKKAADFYNNPKKISRLPVTPWSGIYRRKFLLENNIIFNGLICANDRSFNYMALIKAKSIVFLDDFILYYRVNTPGSLVSVRAKNFTCLFLSYDIIKDTCAALMRKERFYILENELYHIFYCYKKLKKEHAQGEKIAAKTKDFIDSLDISVFRGRMHLCRWYPDYLELKGARLSYIYRAGRFMTKNIRTMLRALRHIKKYDLKSALRLTKTKLNKK